MKTPFSSSDPMRERERESDMGVCFFSLFIFMEFTTQGGSTPDFGLNTGTAPFSILTQKESKDPP
jgi:hypothetical protein